jgi:hypothetical protein
LSACYDKAALPAALTPSDELVNTDRERGYPTDEEKQTAEPEERHAYKSRGRFEQIRNKESDRNGVIKKAQLRDNCQQPRESDPDQ